MRTAPPVRRLTRMAAAATLAAIGLLVGQLSLQAPLASASDQVGWIRLAHLSPNTPAVDVYLYSFGNSTAQIVLHHVGYGDVSPFEQLAAGDYTVAMRLAGAAPSSKPVLSTAVDVLAGRAYTVAGMGPESGLRLEVIPDRLTTPRGKALVQVIQASMQQDTVTVSLGDTKLASNLRFASFTPFVAVKPGSFSARAAGATESTTASVSLSAGSIYTLVVLDNPGTLAIDDLLDAVGSKVAPAGGPQTGLGGAAPRPGAPIMPWAAGALAGLGVALTGTVLLSRRRRPAMHAR